MASSEIRLIWQYDSSSIHHSQASRCCYGQHTLYAKIHHPHLPVMLLSITAFKCNSKVPVHWCNIQTCCISHSFTSGLLRFSFGWSATIIYLLPSTHSKFCCSTSSQKEKIWAYYSSLAISPLVVCVTESKVQDQYPLLQMSPQNSTFLPLWMQKACIIYSTYRIGLRTYSCGVLKPCWETLGTTREIRTKTSCSRSAVELMKEIRMVTCVMANAADKSSKERREKYCCTRLYRDHLQFSAELSQYCDLQDNKQTVKNCSVCSFWDILRAWGKKTNPNKQPNLSFLLFF